MASLEVEAGICAICEDFVSWNSRNGTSWRRHKINWVFPDFSTSKQTYDWAYYHHSNLVTLKDSASDGCRMCQLLLDSLGISDKFDVLFDEQRKQKFRAGHSSLRAPCDPSDVRAETFAEEIVKQIEYENKKESSPDSGRGWRRSSFVEHLHKGKLEGPVVLLTGDSWKAHRDDDDPEDYERYTSASVAGDVASGRLEITFEVQVRVPCSTPIEFDETAGLSYELMVTVLTEDKFDPEVTHRPSRDLLSYSHLKLIRGWREECLTKHTACVRNSSRARLPSRVIEINSTYEKVMEVSVIETHHLEGKHQYACLSYCWGSAKQANMTTTAEFPRKLTLAELPATIADAIRLCHALGYQYLWVDSLCIIQGDVKDWETESAQMCSVYGGSSLTIATEVCDDSVQSFMDRREDIRHFSGPIILLKVNGVTLRPRKRIWVRSIMNDQENSMWNLECRFWASAYDGYQVSTWLKRAWTFQE